MSKGNVLDNYPSPGRRSRGMGDSDATFVPPVVLRVEGLIKIYGKRRVVDGVSFQVRKGEIVGLLGPNGAGKTTSFRMACGLINTNGGVVYLGSQDVTNWPMYRRSREGGMGYLPQDKSVFQKLSVQNNLLGVMEMLGIRRAVRKKRCEELLEKLHLTHLRYNSAGGLSGGERRRLEIARSLVSEPKIILLDEPFAAIDPITVEGIQEIIRQLAKDGISILITDHSVRYMLQIAERCYVIQSGKVLCHGTPEDVITNPEAKKVYFGENSNVEDFQQASAIVSRKFSIDEMSPTFENEETEEKKSPRHSPAHKKHRKTVEPESDTPSAAPASRTPESVAKPVVVSPPPRSPGPDTPPDKPAAPVVRAGSRLKQTAAHKLPEDHPAHSNASKVDEGAVLQAEKINRRQHAVTQETRTRPIGRRLVPTSRTALPESLPERPLVNSSPQEKPEMPMPVAGPTTPEEPPEGMSGIIRTLGSLIWKK